MKIVKKVLIVLFELAAAGLFFYVLFNLSWLFGRKILEGPGLVGNDSDFALSLVSWFGRWWPRIPLWYPLQGTGVSLFYSYPMFSTFLIIWIQRITNLSSAEVFRILSFSAFPLTSFGIYVFARRKTGNFVAAFFAGVFFLLSQASWVFQRLHGIFAQNFSMIFIPWCFLFFDIYLTGKLYKPGNDLTARLALVLTALFTALTFLCHVVAGTVVVLSLVSYAVLISQLSLPRKAKVKERLIGLWKSLTPTVICLILSFCLAAFWLVPFFSYNHLANREGLLNMDMGQLKEVSLLPKTLLGFGDFATGDLRYDYFFFALPVIILAVIGLFASMMVSASVFVWGLVAFGAAIYTTLPLFFPSLVDIFRYLFTAVYFRALMAVIVLLPVTAAFGALFLAEIPFKFVSRLFSKKTDTIEGSGDKIGKTVFAPIRWVFVSIAVFVICLIFIKRFEHRPPDEATQKRPAYGVSAYRAYGPTLGEDIEIIKKDWKVLFSKPEIFVSKVGVNPAPSLLGFVKDFNLDKTSRVDVSAYSGEAFLQRGPVVTEATFVNLYHYFASLIHRMWGYQQGVFYGHDKLYNNPSLLRELSLWFGVEYTTLVPGFDREDNYVKTGWEMVKPGGMADNPLPVYHFPEAEGFLTVSNRPVALVIGSFKDQGYDQVFKSSNAGAFSYSNLWLVEGKARIDDYSLKELSNFNLLIFHGYDYKSKNKAWSLVKKYLENGGKVFVDTGWQYISKDWGAKSGTILMPAVFPVGKTAWKNVSKDWQDYTIDSSLGEFDTSSFKPFLWQGNPWGGAVSEQSWLNKGATALIKDKNDVFVAMRDIGKGKIIWSGLNLFSHAQGADGEKEIGVLKAIFDLLIPEEKSNYASAVWQRDFPDLLNIEFKENSPGVQWLLWREAYTPNWNVKFTGNGKAEIYRGGPGFVLIRIPSIKAGDSLRMEYRLNIFEGILSKMISVLTALGLIVYLAIGNKIKLARVEKVKDRFKNRLRKFAGSISGGETEEY